VRENSEVRLNPGDAALSELITSEKERYISEQIWSKMKA
jgi:hypothetical protein